MNEEYTTSTNLETADSLDAVVAFRSFKNLMFWVACICLVALQGIFWAMSLGHINKADCPCPEAQPAAAETALPPYSDSHIVTLVAAAIETETPATPTPATPTPETADTPQTDAPAAYGGCQAKCPQTASLLGAGSLIETLKNPTCREAICVISTLNYILFLAVVLFSLTLLIILKISIAGRLGGINHISRAFLQALLLLVLIVPWQVCLPDTVVGAIYTPTELLCSKIVRCGASFYDCIFYFGRFVGLWAIVTILLIAAEIRSIRWSRAVTRRLQAAK